MNADPFHWVDGERTIVFGRGKLAEAHNLIGDRPYTLLTTERAATAAPEIVQHAATVHHVGSGRVDEIAATLRADVQGELLVALGGGRVIDTAKALAAAAPPTRVAAIPTTLSGAEMTHIHRHAAGAPAHTPHVRPALVINDPALSASQPPPELMASAGNAIGHALEGPLTSLRNPVANLAALEATCLIAAALGREAHAAEEVADQTVAREFVADEARDALALGSLLAGYVIGSTGYGLHHVLAQTLVRVAGIGHGPANAIMLPESTRALAGRFPAEVQRFGRAAGEDPVDFASRLRERTGTPRLREVVAGQAEVLERCADQAALRPEVASTPPPAGREEILALYRAAW